MLQVLNLNLKLLLFLFGLIGGDGGLYRTDSGAKLNDDEWPWLSLIKHSIYFMVEKREREREREKELGAARDSSDSQGRMLKSSSLA